MKNWFQNVPLKCNLLRSSEGWFRRFATVAVAVEPGAAVCMLAGTSRRGAEYTCNAELTSSA